MKSFLAILGLVVAVASSAQAAKLATYQGRIFSDGVGNFLVDQGQWTSAAKECKGFIDTRTEKMGFAVWDQTKKFKGIQQCDDAIVTLDLENSSFCKNQFGAEMYYAPKVIAIQCL